MYPFSILLIFLAMLIIIMNWLTLTGFPNFIKHLTNKDTLLVPKIFYKSCVNIPYKIVNCCKREVSNVL
jgi:hypothetical protein